jgi:hypothetical protein
MLEFICSQCKERLEVEFGNPRQVKVIPCSDCIREEGYIFYDEGYERGKEDGIVEAEKTAEEAISEAYEQGREAGYEDGYSAGEAKGGEETK